MIKELFLYSAKQCELCVVMQRDLKPFLTDGSVVVLVIDIEDDAELKHRYGARIPVLVSGDTEICEQKLDIPVLQAFLSEFRQ